jgi:Na+-driven multidrug efflux pump
MSGWTTYAKVDQLVFLPMQSIALASTTFVGQNLGCNQVDRARKGINRALILALCVTAMVMVPIVVFAPQIVSFFNSKTEVVEYGTMLIRWISPFYMLCCFNQIYSAAQRGVGNSKVPMVIMLISFVAFRQVYLFIMSRVWNEILPIAMGYPAGWFLSSFLSTVYYHTHKDKLDRFRLIEDK